MNSQDTEALAYVHHLLRQHASIEEEVLEVERVWLGDLPASVVTAELRRLRSIIKEHFEEELEGGCIDEAVARAPHLSHEAARIEREHATLLVQIDLIVDRLDQGRATACPPADLRRDFEDFVEELRQHEAAENHLVEEAFGIELEMDLP